MVQTTEHGLAANRDPFGQTISQFQIQALRRRHWRVRHARSQRHVRTSTVVVGGPRFQYRPQMRLRQWDEPIQALAADRTDHPFTDRIHKSSQLHAS